MSDPLHLDREDAVSVRSEPGAEARRSWRRACGDGHLDEAMRDAALGVHGPLGTRSGSKSCICCTTQASCSPVGPFG